MPTHHPLSHTHIGSLTCPAIQAPRDLHIFPVGYVVPKLQQDANLCGGGGAPAEGGGGKAAPRQQELPCQPCSKTVPSLPQPPPGRTVDVGEHGVRGRCRALRCCAAGEDEECDSQSKHAGQSTRQPRGQCSLRRSHRRDTTSYCSLFSMDLMSELPHCTGFFCQPAGLFRVRANSPAPGLSEILSEAQLGPSPARWQMAAPQVRQGQLRRGAGGRPPLQSWPRGSYPVSSIDSTLVLGLSPSRAGPHAPPKHLGTEFRRAPTQF